MYNKIEKIIFEFYKVAVNDLLIGYHFKKISNFEEHIPHIAIFWNNRLDLNNTLKSNRAFSIINAHKSLGIKEGEIDRWVVLFKENIEKFELDRDFKNRWLIDVDHFAKILKQKLC